MHLILKLGERHEYKTLVFPFITEIVKKGGGGGGQKENQVTYDDKFRPQ